MTADIKYTVKYHARPVKKVAMVLIWFGAIMLLLLALIWMPFQVLPPEMQALAMLQISLRVFGDLNVMAIFILATGVGLQSLKWRSGKILLTDEKLIIEGSYYVSIWLKNMWEVDVQDLNHKFIIRLDSNVDAVQIRFKTAEEFVSFSETLVALVEGIENIKLKRAPVSLEA